MLAPHSALLRSGRRESNPVYMTPSHVYCQHTPARLPRVYTRGVGRCPLVGPPGIEPGPYEPESHVLPAYSGPVRDTSRVPTLPNIGPNENVPYAFLLNSKSDGVTFTTPSCRSVCIHRICA